MNLIIDIGNSSVKLAVFEGQKKITQKSEPTVSAEYVDSLVKEYRIGKAIISSVKAIPGFLEDLLRSKVGLFHVLSSESKLPFTIKYKTRETLGTDRIAAVAGAWKSFTGSDVLIVDAGTAITYDYLSGNKYIGGNISPGIDLRFRALNAFTGKLPLVSRTDSYSDIGTSTKEAIVSGVITGVIFEINEYIRTFVRKNKDAHIIITGGDGGFLEEKISYSCQYLPDLVIEGLNFILEYNA